MESQLEREDVLTIYGLSMFNPIPVVPHKAVAEVSKIGNLQERFVVVSHGSQSKATDGPKGGWSVGLFICLSICLSS